ncbi:MAG: DUF1932 domain-containing protein [Exilibacterium sp.]
MSMKVAIFGIGEAGALIAADLVACGVSVAAYDPAPVATPAAVQRCLTPREAVTGADAVFGVTAMADARTALEQALDAIPPEACYADFSTSAAALKRTLADIAAARQLPFVDIALLATVPGKGLKTPALAAGTAAERFVETFAPLGMPVEAIGDRAGDAATRKLLRSVFMKGLAALVIEAMQAAEKADLSDWLWGNLAEEICRADEALLSRLVRGTGPHARRRLHEMEASQALLEDLGVDPLMTRGTVENLRRVLAQGMPDIIPEVD